ncbi:hypothetical protein ZWY2020_008676 [Hordeum vulgare]|nr:hypothetical protein ZWY2020_008676 [Hordeum vulgare]
MGTAGCHIGQGRKTVGSERGRTCGLDGEEGGSSAPGTGTESDEQRGKQRANDGEIWGSDQGARQWVPPPHGLRCSEPEAYLCCDALTFVRFSEKKPI